MRHSRETIKHRITTVKVMARERGLRDLPIGGNGYTVNGLAVASVPSGYQLRVVHTDHTGQTLLMSGSAREAVHYLDGMITLLNKLPFV